MGNLGVSWLTHTPTCGRGFHGFMGNSHCVTACQVTPWPHNHHPQLQQQKLTMFLAPAMMMTRISKEQGSWKATTTKKSPNDVRDALFGPLCEFFLIFFFRVSLLLTNVSYFLMTKSVTENAAIQKQAQTGDEVVKGRQRQ